MFGTARWKLTGLILLVFALVLGGLGAAAYWSFSSRIYTGVDAELTGQQRNVMAQLPFYGYLIGDFFSNRSQSIPTEYRVLVANPNGEVNESSECPNPFIMPAIGCYHEGLTPTSQGGIEQAIKNAKSTSPWQPGDPARYMSVHNLRTVTYRGQPWRVLTSAVILNSTPLGIVQIARVVTGEESALQQLRNILLLAGIIGLILATLSSIFLADRALVPIKQAFGRQRQFTADASHELRTPLALIRANAEMLYRHRGPSDAADGELIGEIIRETDHLNRLVGDLLTLARADAESRQLIAKPVDFRALVQSVHEDLQAIAGSRDIGTDLALDGPVTVNGDEVRLRQLLLILLDNALKYTDPGGRVDVSIRREDNRARLVVSDTGIGIPAKDQAHIFERFYRVDRAREHESGGTGLGLAIAHWIVQAHHGSIKVESVSGEGSKFQVDLPAS